MTVIRPLKISQNGLDGQGAVLRKRDVEVVQIRGPRKWSPNTLWSITSTSGIRFGVIENLGEKPTQEEIAIILSAFNYVLGR